MRRLLIFLAIGCCAGTSAKAQSAALQGPVESAYGLLANSVANLHAEGDSLWAGPFLNLTFDRGASWLVADSDSLFGTPNRVFSLDIEGSIIWAGIGRSDRSTGESVQTAAGFLVSEDGGATFSYRFAQLDDAGATTISYGVNELDALPVIVPQQSPPFDIDYDPRTGTVWVAGWASGIRKSLDGGRTWQRVVLPPDELTAIHPDSSYDFRVEPQRGGTGELNHMGFGILADEAGTIWAGTPLGVNRSLDGGVSWRRFSTGRIGEGLTGSWVISIEEQPLPGPNPIWMATWNGGSTDGGQFGVTVTRDGGATFDQALHGERIYDFAFAGETVYAAGDRGLFISHDGGIIWESVRQFQDRQRPDQRIRTGTAMFSVATTPAGDLWVGTEDGLLLSRDGGQTWTLNRVNVPTRPSTPDARAPRVDAYAYPNPFSPAIDRQIRIRYDLERSGTVRVRILDFGMGLVREFSEVRAEGAAETVWDGRDARGVRPANGTYFYSVSGPGGFEARGTILIIE